MIMIIINFTGIIGYRLYLFSSTGPPCLSIPLPPSSPSLPAFHICLHAAGQRRAYKERKKTRKRERERERRVYLQAHKATIRDIKMSGEGKGGRLKVEAAWNRLIKNYFDWCNRRDRYAIKRRDNFR